MLELHVEARFTYCDKLKERNAEDVSKTHSYIHLTESYSEAIVTIIRETNHQLLDGPTDVQGRNKLWNMQRCCLKGFTVNKSHRTVPALAMQQRILTCCTGIQSQYTVWYLTWHFIRIWVYWCLVFIQDISELCTIWFEHFTILYVKLGLWEFVTFIISCCVKGYCSVLLCMHSVTCFSNCV